MQYGFLETRPYSTQLRLKKQDLFNDADIGDGGGEKGEEKLGILNSIESIANLLNIDVFRFHEH